MWRPGIVPGANDGWLRPASGARVGETGIAGAGAIGLDPSARNGGTTRSARRSFARHHRERQDGLHEQGPGRNRRRSVPMPMVRVRHTVRMQRLLVPMRVAVLAHRHGGRGHDRGDHRHRRYQDDETCASTPAGSPQLAPQLVPAVNGLPWTNKNNNAPACGALRGVGGSRRTSCERVPGGKGGIRTPDTGGPVCRISNPVHSTTLPPFLLVLAPVVTG